MDHGHDHGHLTGDSILRTVTASEFKAKCLKLMDQVARSGEPILITKKGRPVSRLEPAGGTGARLFGTYAGRLEIVGDATAPLDVEWEAASNGSGRHARSSVGGAGKRAARSRRPPADRPRKR